MVLSRSMSVHHIHTQKVAFTPAHVQLSCDGVYLALPLTRTSVGVWSLQDIECKALELVGHRKTLTSLALGNVSVPKQLVSAADDYVIVWNLHAAREQAQIGGKIRGHVIGTTLGNVQYCSFSPDDSMVAACIDYTIVILQSSHESKVAVLEGHIGTVTAAEFCPQYTLTLVSISEDRTFKIWNLSDLSLVYQSPILTASPFLSIAMSLHEPHVAIGAADGIIRIFDLTDGNGFRLLHSIDVSKIIAREKDNKILMTNECRKRPVTISSRPTWKQNDKNMSTMDTSDSTQSSVETGFSVLGLYFTYTHSEEVNRLCPPVTNDLPFLHSKSHIVNDLLTTSLMLMVGTTAGLLQVNTRSLEASNFVDFQEPIAYKDNCEKSEQKILNAAGSVLFGQGHDNQMWCIIGSPFQNVVHVLCWHSDHQVTADSLSLGVTQPVQNLETNMAALSMQVQSPEGTQSQSELTVLSNASLLEDSPLRADIVPKKKDSAERKPRDFVTPTKKSSIQDNQPLTFKTKIKSSGYTAAPRMTMFKPQISASKSKSSNSSRTLTASRQAREYPIQRNPPINLDMKLEVDVRPTAVNCIQVSDDGQKIACALANKSAIVFSLPLSKQVSTAYSGHNHIVTSVNWSHCGSQLLTSSDDKTASVWIKGQSEPVLTFDKVEQNVVASEGSTCKNSTKCFSKEVHAAQFYFMDKFILLCSGNSLFLYKYFIDHTKNDIQRYLTQSRYKLVQQWNMESQLVSALSAINSFLSYIAICASSNKSVEVFDMNVGQQVRKMADVHTRPVHAICQNEGSQFVSHPPSAYDLFATAAAGDCIKLWDLRTNRCVRRYEGHSNRVHPCGLAFSPCGRFIGSGSEDKCTYIFDMRSGTYIHKLMGHTDVVADVAFHPLHPQLFTASLDGKLQLYNNNT